MSIDSVKFSISTNWKITTISSWDFQRLFAQQKLKLKTKINELYMQSELVWISCKAQRFSIDNFNIRQFTWITMYLRLDQEHKFNQKKKNENRNPLETSIEWISLNISLQWKRICRQLKSPRATQKKANKSRLFCKSTKYWNQNIYKLCSWNWATAEWSEVWRCEAKSKKREDKRCVRIVIAFPFQLLSGWRKKKEAEN